MLTLRQHHYTARFTDENAQHVVVHIVVFTNGLPCP